MPTRRQYITGNWKMNKGPVEAKDLAVKLKDMLAGFDQADVAVCPPFVSVPAVADVLKGSKIEVGGQNLHWKESGALTGEVSGPMLMAAGCALVIIGHSERRQLFAETDEMVNKRVVAALACRLKPIVCVGETLDERKKNVTTDVVGRQIRGAFAGLTAGQMETITIAYEPVWAIGTGVNATPGQAQEVHQFIRGQIRSAFGVQVAGAIRIQYGGSVKPENAKELLAQPDIDGALVGGASLVPEQFNAVVRSART